MSKVFLSYAHEDIGMAKRVYNDLKRYKLDVWFDNESLLPGQVWRDEIQEAIENSDFFLALLSSKSLTKRGYVQKELKIALDVLDLYPENKVYVIPVRIKDCKVLNRKLQERHLIDLFPEREYYNGIRKILKVVSPGVFMLRNQSTQLSNLIVHDMITKHAFYDGNRNPGSKGFSHQYKEWTAKGHKVIRDYITGLIWQKSGSSKELNYDRAKMWVEELARKGYAGFHDWRLPTLEEAMSLTALKVKRGLHIASLFDARQDIIWTSDGGDTEWSEWVVAFSYGGASCYSTLSEFYVRAVCSG
jgi:hypothetical protein